jgi:Fe2+ or Zn2+ uptake regulation protein
MEVPVNKNRASRSTAQRRAILEVLRCSEVDHPTAQEVYEQVRKRIPNISLGTVYRALAFLSDRGDVSRVEVAVPRARFDHTTDEHAHIICLECGRIEDLDLKSGRETDDGCMTALLASARRCTGFSIPDQGVLLRGLCPDCSSGSQ